LTHGSARLSGDETSESSHKVVVIVVSVTTCLLLLLTGALLSTYRQLKRSLKRALHPTFATAPLATASPIVLELGAARAMPDMRLNDAALAAAASGHACGHACG